MISGELVGGLGNQMFILITTIATAIKYNKSYVFNRIGCSPSCFNSRSTYWNNLFRNVATIAEYDSRQNVVEIHQPRFEYDPIILPSSESDMILLKGYRQSYKFFDAEFHQIAEIMDIANMREQVKMKVQSIYGISNIDDAISIHFRLGDYVHLQHTHPLMPVQYYENAINMILAKIANNTHEVAHRMEHQKQCNIIYFFEESDIDMVNIVYINYLIVKFPQIHFIRGSYAEIDDWEQMLAMSLCKHNIIGNSSFSWWSAYISAYSSSDNNVCYPHVWFSNELRDRTYDMCPSNWNKISW